METEQKKNVALLAEEEHKTAVESAEDYVENFDILETITNVGNDEVFTPRKTCDLLLDALPEEVWTNPNYHWLNPATKNGVFEREIALRLNKGLKDVIPDDETRKKHILQDMIYSIGQTKFTANVARRTLYYCSQANRKCDGIKAPDGHYVNGYAIGNGSWFTDEEGNIKTPNTNHDFGSDGKCRFCGIGSDSKYVSPTQREQYAYEFIHIDPSELADHLSQRFFGGNKEMKFDIIIGNPPYQLGTNDKGIQAIPIYGNFVEQAISLAPKYVSMIIQSRWFTGGMGMDDFRKKMLNDRHIRLIHDFPKSRDCFSDVDIAGGVCFFTWERDYSGDCQIVSQIGNKITETTRSLNEFNVLIRDNIGIKIIRKIKKKTNIMLDSTVSSICPFGISTSVRGKEGPFSGSVKLYTSAGPSYISRSQVTKGIELIDKYKVSIGQLNPDRGGVNNAVDGKSNVTTKVKVYGPNEVFSATYLLLGSFSEEAIAHNFESYMKTKFVRFLILLTLSSMHITKESFLFVPAEDFSITWNDKMLYEKYDLSDEEIDAIEDSIKEMK